MLMAPAAVMPVERSKLTLEIWNSCTISWEKFCCVSPSTESFTRAPSTAMRVRLVAAAARHDVDGSGGRNACREIEVDAGDLEFLHDFLGEILLRVAIHGIVQEF